MSSRASLNHIYRTVWNQALGAMVAVAEISSAGGQSGGARVRSLESQQPGGIRLGLLALLVALAWSVMPGAVHANPTGGVAVAGSATFVNTGNKLLVTTQNAAGQNFSAINWQSFSIPTGSTTYFQQPGASSTSINRVVTNTPTQIFGTLSSNGNLVLVNQAGIAVGNGAVIDTNGFTASSLAMSDADAMAGRLRFGDGQITTSGVSVNGGILARNGDVVLLGSSVNTGADALVQAPNGSTILAAGQQIEITGRGLEGIRLQVQAPTDSAVNLGSLSGDAVGMFAGTLKHSGLIQATTATLEGGRVVLKAAGDTIIEGNGSIVATGVHGGSADVLGNRVGLTDHASINVSGQLGGGTIRVGGDFQGKNPDIPNASMTAMGAQTVLTADALQSGDGGRVIVWADDQTKAYGAIRAQGGAMSGNGGFVEVSGKNKLSFEGQVNTLAAHGLAGTLLLDPDQIDVDNAGTALITDVNLFGALPGTTQTVSPATLNAVGGNVVLQATQEINFNSPVNLTTNGASLTAQAGGVITVGASIGTTNGNVTLTTTATGGNGGAVYVNQPINAGTGTILLHSDGSDVGGNSIYLNGNLLGGTVTLEAPNARIEQVGGGITANTLNASASNSIVLQGSNAVSNLGSLTVSSGTQAASFWSTGNLDLGTISVGGDLDIKSNNGNITQSGSMTTGGSGYTVNINAGTGNIDLTGTNNVASAAVNLTGSAIAMYSSGGLNVSTLNRNGTHALDLETSGGALTIPSGAINTGTEDLTLISGSSISTSGNLTGANITLQGNGIYVNDVINATTGLLKLDGGSGGINQVNSTGSPNYLHANSLEALSSGYGSISLANPNNQVGTLAAYASGSGASILFKGSSTLDIGYAGNTYGLYADGSITVINTAPINISENITSYNSSVSLTSSGAITHTDDDYYGKISAATGITLSATSIGASGGTSGYGGGVGYGNSVLLYPGSGDVIMTASSGNIYAFGTSDLNVGNVTATSGSVNLMSTYDMNIHGTITAGASGNAVVLDATDGYFTVGGYGGINLTTAGARWLLYAQDDGYGGYVSLSGLTPAFKQYGTYNDGTNANVLGSGSGIIYYNNTGSATLGGSLTKVYDGTTAMPLTASNISGFSSGVAGDTGGSYADSNATLDDANVGTGKTVTLNWVKYTGVTALENSGGMTVYYVPYGVTGTGAVTPARVNIALSGSGSRVYDGTNIVNASIFTLNGLINGETLTLSGAGTVGDKNVGDNKPVTLGSLTLGDGTGLASNYSLGSFTASITPLAITSVSGLLVDTKVYDGKTTATLTANSGALSGKIAGDDLSLSGIANFDNKNAGTNKSASISSPSLSGADARNYKLELTSGSPVSAIGSITQLELSSISGLVGDASRQYNAKNDATVQLSTGKLDGVIAGDTVTLSGVASGTFTDGIDVGSHALSVVVSGTSSTLGGADAGNYKLSQSVTGTGTGSIIQRASSLWTGAAGNGLWSDAKNWDVLPSGSNVAAVTNLSGATVIYDLGVSTQLSGLSVSNLTISGTGGLVLGGLTVSNGYNQTNGSVSSTGPIAIAQTSGNLVVGVMKAPSVTLTSIGNITQTGALETDTLSTTSVTGTTLTNVQNKIKSYTGTNTGAGNIALTTIGAMKVNGGSTSNGNFTVVNYGGIDVTSGITANGSVSLTANSPLTIDAPITATGNIDLVATNQTSEGNITINGAVRSSGGSVAVAAASNYVQNGTIAAALGVTATAGGSMTFGPEAITTGHPVNFEAAGTVVIPPGSTPTVGSTPTDFVATFMSNFESALIAQNSSTGDPNDKKKDKDVVVEGQSCTR